jgi:hypothetical protein
MQKVFTNHTSGKRQWHWLNLLLLALAIGTGRSGQASLGSRL